MAAQINIPNLDGLNLPLPLTRTITQFGQYINAILNLLSSSAGVLTYTQNQIPASGSTVGQKIYVSDYDHFLAWDGQTWQWAAGERGSDFFEVSPGNVIFKADGVTLRAGWHKCDGSTVNYLKPNGQVASRVLPNTNGSTAYVKVGNAYAPTITAATVPTSSTPTFTGTPGTTGAPSATAQIGTGAANAASSTHTHSFTPAGTISTPTISLPGDPVANFEAILYYRQ